MSDWTYDEPYICKWTQMSDWTYDRALYMYVDTDE